LEIRTSKTNLLGLHVSIPTGKGTQVPFPVLPYGGNMYRTFYLSFSTTVVRDKFDPAMLFIKSIIYPRADEVNTLNWKKI
jgi:hypothetical protein